MSNFAIILKNMVGSGMENTEAALVILEAFFENEDSELSHSATTHKSQIADINRQLIKGEISMEAAQYVFNGIKNRALFLIDQVETITFDDSIAIKYFEMLDPDPTYDPEFSPLKKPVVPPKETLKAPLNELPFESKKKDKQWSSWALPVGGVFCIGSLVYFLFFKEADIQSAQPAYNSNSVTPQPTIYTPPIPPTLTTKPQKVDKNAELLRMRAIQVQEKENKTKPSPVPQKPAVAPLTVPKTNKVEYESVTQKPPKPDQPTKIETKSSTVVSAQQSVTSKSVNPTQPVVAAPAKTDTKPSTPVSSPTKTATKKQVKIPEKTIPPKQTKVLKTKSLDKRTEIIQGIDSLKTKQSIPLKNTKNGQ